jgi:hypothetical protein
VRLSRAFLGLRVSETVEFSLPSFPTKELPLTVKKFTATKSGHRGGCSSSRREFPLVVVSVQSAISPGDSCGVHARRPHEGHGPTAGARDTHEERNSRSKVDGSAYGIMLWELASLPRRKSRGIFAPAQPLASFLCATSSRHSKDSSAEKFPACGISKLVEVISECRSG